MSFTEPTLLSSVRIQKPVSTTSNNKWPTALDIQIESVEDYPGVLSDFQVSLFDWFFNYYTQVRYVFVVHIVYYAIKQTTQI